MSFLLKLWADSESPSPANINNHNTHWKKLWNLRTIPRHKALLWRIIQQAIPVKSTLAKRGINCNILCPRCLQHEETIDHAFMHCDQVSRVWFGSNLNIRFNNSHNSFSDWLIYVLQALKEDQLIYLASLTYSIWYARNQQVFNQKEIKASETISKATSSIQDYYLANTNNIQNQPSNEARSTHRQQHRNSIPNQNRVWHKPDTGCIKINCDANLARSGRWGLGAICRDHDGALVAAATWEMPGTDDPTLAEAYALYQAILLARDCCFLRVQFESDNQRIISLINNGGSRPRNYLGNIIWGILCNRDHFRHCSFHHVHREANRAAHQMASLAHEEPNRVWIEDEPPQLVISLIRDLLH
jgi:hypothetical protein